MLESNNKHALTEPQVIGLLANGRRLSLLNPEKDSALVTCLNKLKDQDFKKLIDKYQLSVKQQNTILVYFLFADEQLNFNVDRLAPLVFSLFKSKNANLLSPELADKIKNQPAEILKLLKKMIQLLNQSVIGTQGWYSTFHVLYSFLDDSQELASFLAQAIHLNPNDDWSALLVSSLREVSIEEGMQIDNLHDDEPKRLKYVKDLKPSTLVGLLSSDVSYFFPSSNVLLLKRFFDERMGNNLTIEQFQKKYGLDDTHMAYFMMRAWRYGFGFGNLSILSQFAPTNKNSEEKLGTVIDVLFKPLLQSFDLSYFEKLANIVEDIAKKHPNLKPKLIAKLDACKKQLLQTLSHARATLSFSHDARAWIDNSQVSLNGFIRNNPVFSPFLGPLANSLLPEINVSSDNLTLENRLKNNNDQEKRIRRAFSYLLFFLDPQSKNIDDHAAVSNAHKNASQIQNYDPKKYRSQDGKTHILEVFAPDGTEQTHLEMTQKFLEKKGFKLTKKTTRSLVYENATTHITLYRALKEEDSFLKFEKDWIAHNPQGIMSFRGHVYSLLQFLPPSVFDNKKGNYLLVLGNCGGSGYSSQYVLANSKTNLSSISFSSTGKGMVTNVVLWLLSLQNNVPVAYSEILKQHEQELKAAGGSRDGLVLPTVGDGVVKYVVSE